MIYFVAWSLYLYRCCIARKQAARAPHPSWHQNGLTTARMAIGIKTRNGSYCKFGKSLGLQLLVCCEGLDHLAANQMEND